MALSNKILLTLKLFALIEAGNKAVTNSVLVSRRFTYFKNADWARLAKGFEYSTLRSVVFRMRAGPSNVSKSRAYKYRHRRILTMRIPSSF